MRVYEVFLKKAGRDPFVHAGSLEAPDPAMAELMARESYARRGEGDQMWLVDRTDVVVADTDLLAANADRPHRHNDGARVAEHRRAARGAT